MISPSLTIVANSTSVFYFLAIIPHTKVFTSVLMKVELGPHYTSFFLLQSLKVVLLTLSRQSEFGHQVCHTNWLPVICLLFREDTVVVKREAGLLFPCVTGLYPVAQKIG